MADQEIVYIQNYTYLRLHIKKQLKKVTWFSRPLLEEIIGRPPGISCQQNRILSPNIHFEVKYSKKVKYDPRHQMEVFQGHL
jgi:hypothetical protein